MAKCMVHVHVVRAYPDHIKQIRVFLTPPGLNAASPSLVAPSTLLGCPTHSSVPLYSPGWREVLENEMTYPKTQLNVCGKLKC